MSNYNNRTIEYNELKKEYSELRKDYIRANRNHRDNTAGLLIATGLFTGILLILSGK
jgi:hypothetical protein